MKGFVLAFGVCLVGLSGCCCGNPATTTGWKFEVGKPGTVSSPALWNQMNGPVGIAPVAAYPAIPAGASAFAAGVPCGSSQTLSTEFAPPPRALQPRMNAAADNCTLDEVCKMLMRIEKRLGTAAAPMPKTPDQD